MKLTSKQKGIMFLILSALCFASMNLSAKLAGSLPSMQKAFFRNLIAAVVSFAVLINSKEKFHLNKKNLPFFFMRAIFGTMGIVGNFYAIEHMLLADASILAKLAPFFAILFSICTPFPIEQGKIRPFLLFPCSFRPFRPKAMLFLIFPKP